MLNISKRMWIEEIDVDGTADYTSLHYRKFVNPDDLIFRIRMNNGFCLTLNYDCRTIDTTLCIGETELDTSTRSFDINENIYICETIDYIFDFLDQTDEHECCEYGYTNYYMYNSANDTARGRDIILDLFETLIVAVGEDFDIIMSKFVARSMRTLTDTVWEGFIPRAMLTAPNTDYDGIELHLWWSDPQTDLCQGRSLSTARLNMVWTLMLIGLRLENTSTSQNYDDVFRPEILMLIMTFVKHV